MKSIRQRILDKKRRKNSRFQFSYKNLHIYIPYKNTIIKKKVFCCVLGNYAFHEYFKNRYTIIDIRTGYTISQYKKRSHAKTVIKKLHLNSDYKEILTIIKPNKLKTKEDINNTYVDIPF